jgi:signal transduction histidine kinase
VCHELGNALNAIGLSAELLEVERPSPVKEVKQGIRRGVHFMRGMIRDLQELGDLAGGQLTLTASSFSPSALTKEIASAFEAVTRAKGLQLSFTSDPSLSMVVTDEHRLKQVALRLVSNAVKYTESGGEVKFEIRDVDVNRWAITVSDTGAGIAPEFQQKVFEEFFRVAQTSGAEGAGLGLAITIRLVQLLEGEATLESQPGKGSRFEVVFPKNLKRL